MNINCIKSKLRKGFSLIELMVVIAIVALLTAVAIPSYQGYLQNSKVTEIFSLASEQMKQWQQQYNLNGSFDVTNAPTNGIGSYIDAVELYSGTGTPSMAGCTDAGLGVVCVQLNDPSNINTVLDGLVLRFTASEAGTVTGDTSNTTINWTCTFPTGADDDTIEELLSPGDCTAA